MSACDAGGSGAFPLGPWDCGSVGLPWVGCGDHDWEIVVVAFTKFADAFDSTAKRELRAAEAFDEYERNPGKVLRIVIDSTAS